MVRLTTVVIALQRPLILVSVLRLSDNVFATFSLVAVVNSVDFVSRNGDSVVFRTCSEEAEKVVFQIGTADAVLALKAAETVCVANCNCLCSCESNRGCWTAVSCLPFGGVFFFFLFFCSFPAAHGT